MSDDAPGYVRDLRAAIISGSPASPLVELIKDRVFWGRRPQASETPCIMLREIGRIDDVAMDGPTGLVSSRMQCVCFGELFDTAKAVAGAGKLLLNGFKGTQGETEFQGIFVRGESDFNDPQGVTVDRFYEVTLDLLVWHCPA